MELLALATYAGEVLASSNGDDDGFPIAALLLLAGPIFYMYVFFRYRNADKRHMHESETDSAILDVQVADQKSGRITGVSHATMNGANHRSVRGAQQGLGNFGIDQKKISDITRGVLGKD